MPEHSSVIVDIGMPKPTDDEKHRYSGSAEIVSLLKIGVFLGNNFALSAAHRLFNTCLWIQWTLRSTTLTIHFTFRLYATGF